jgi:regulatory protein YycH of two-component signal transduction system YycFG
MQIVKSLPYQNFIYALKLKDIKRQYPVMLSRFLNSMDVRDSRLFNNVIISNYNKNIISYARPIIEID